MGRQLIRHLAGVVLLLILGVSLAEARVVRFVIEQRRVFAEGTEFGEVGQYERLDGTVYMEVDPDDPLNAVLVNLDRAPRNARGLVEFSTTFFILKPVDIARGNGKIFYGINNRGNKLESGLRWHYVPSSNDPISAEHAGDGFLMRLGYTVVDRGWQGDVVGGERPAVPAAPVATEADGSPIVARIRVELSDRGIPYEGTFTLPLKGSSNFRPYPTADMDPGNASLTVRATPEGPGTPIAADAWAYGRCPQGRSSLEPSETHICLFEGFRTDRLYELIYPGKNPLVMGLGYAVTRDVASSCATARTTTKATRIRWRAAQARWATAGRTRRGSSSTGMYLRDYLYLGFNEDEEHRQVFDAVNIQIPGTHRLFANVAFADPNTYSRQDDRRHFLSTSYPPMQFAVVSDPLSGIRDGILKRPETDPLVFQTDTENEFYSMKASLNVHDGLGRPVFVPRQRAAVPPLELPARRRQPGSDCARFQRAVREPHESELQRANAARAGDGARRLGRPRRGAAAEPLSARGERHARGAGRLSGPFSEDPRGRHGAGSQRGVTARLRARVRFYGRFSDAAAARHRTALPRTGAGRRRGRPQSDRHQAYRGARAARHQPGLERAG